MGKAGFISSTVVQGSTLGLFFFFAGIDAVGSTGVGVAEGMKLCEVGLGLRCRRYGTEQQTPNPKPKAQSQKLLQVIIDLSPTKARAVPVIIAPHRS